MQNHNDDAIKTSDTVLYKNIPLTLLKGLYMSGSWWPDRAATYWPQLLWPLAFLSRSPGLLHRGPGGPATLGAGFLYRKLSPTCLIPNWLNFLSTELYNSSRSVFFMQESQIALIQHVHGQGYPDIPRPDAPVIYTGAFPILTAWQGRRSMCNNSTVAFSACCWVYRFQSANILLFAYLDHWNGLQLAKASVLKVERLNKGI